MEEESGFAKYNDESIEGVQLRLNNSTLKTIESVKLRDFHPRSHSATETMQEIRISAQPSITASVSIKKEVLSDTFIQ